MDEGQHHEGVQRALELGRAGDPDGLVALEELLQKPSPEIRRLAASAIGKLAAVGADEARAVKVLIPVALKDLHPQVQQNYISPVAIMQ